MNINELIKEAHENAVEKGFYDCPECEGEGRELNNCLDDMGDCPVCNGTGKDPNRNISELLMLIVSELGEAQEALRKRFFSDMTTYINCTQANDMFREDKEEYLKMQFDSLIKDTFEDEIADTLIKIFDLCGYLNLELDTEFICGISCAVNRSEALLDIVEMLIDIKKKFKFNRGKDYIEFKFLEIIKYIEFACQCWNIDIEKHIQAKMEYNKTRQNKHGKAF